MNQVSIPIQRVRAESTLDRPVKGKGTRPSLAIVLLLIAFFVPSQASFVVGGLVFPSYRIVILIFLIPAVFLVTSRRLGTAGWVDLLVLGVSAWFIIATAQTDGLARGLEGGGAYAVDFLGTYALVRAYVTKESHVVWIAKFFAIGFLILMPFMIFESFTGKHVLKDMVAMVVGRNFYSVPDKRWGFERAWGVFDHPILAGVIISTSISLVWFSIDSRKPIWVRLGWVAGPALATMTTFSSGALAALVIQVMLVTWYYTTQSLKHRWLWLGTGFAFCYCVLEILSNRTAYEVLISFLTFNPGTGFYRIEIIHWGFYYNVLREPIFGIGESDWIRAAWMHSSSVDNFWLRIAMYQGVPMFVMVTSAVMFAFCGNRKMPPGTTDIRLGWTFSMIAICIAACTVHYWNHSFIWFAFFLGLGTLWLRPSPPVRKKVAGEYRQPDGAGRAVARAGVKHARGTSQSLALQRRRHDSEWKNP